MKSGLLPAICAAAASVVLAPDVWPPARSAAAQMIPQLPAPLEMLLEKSGVLARGDAALLFRNAQAVFRPPVRNAEFADLMERARREDQVVPLTHALFSPDAAAIGHWHSAFYLDNYGTALFLPVPFAPDRVPVVLIHGINGSPRDFAELGTWLQDRGFQPVYFVYPSGMALDAAAHQLGKRLQAFLDRHAVERFVMIGHSMGGVVAKALLDEVDVGDDLPSWRLFLSISSPFGGIDTAQYADRLPRHPPAWDDLIPSSGFIRKVQSTPFPRGLSFYLFFGARSSQRLMAALGNNDGVLTLASMCDTPVTQAASDVFGFYEDHTSILAAPQMLRRLETILYGEL
jgi:pimeloyl-ACP methyl ester carboxylesterase